MRFPATSTCRWKETSAYYAVTVEKKAYKAFVLEDMTNIIVHHKYIDRQLKL